MSDYTRYINFLREQGFQYFKNKFIVSHRKNTEEFSVFDTDIMTGICYISLAYNYDINTDQMEYLRCEGAFYRDINVDDIFDALNINSETLRSLFRSMKHFSDKQDPGKIIQIPYEMPHRVDGNQDIVFRGISELICMNIPNE